MELVWDLTGGAGIPTQFTVSGGETSDCKSEFEVQLDQEDGDQTVPESRVIEQVDGVQCILVKVTFGLSCMFSQVLVYLPYMCQVYCR